MAFKKVLIRSNPNGLKTVAIGSASQKRIRTIALGAATSATSMSTMNDVDLSGLDDGEALVWNETLQKFVIEKPDVDGGTF